MSVQGSSASAIPNASGDQEASDGVKPVARATQKRGFERP